uniref:Uncharacterized protein n=1 Tax=Rhizophora mucronata TaxID=61149 RepID=A0A2P2Q7T6_RHIMU
MLLVLFSFLLGWRVEKGGKDQVTCLKHFNKSLANHIFALNHNLKLEKIKNLLSSQVIEHRTGK